MKCLKHHSDAVAICAYCGRAVCSDCIVSLTAPRMVCSVECGSALARDDRAVQSILQKSVQNLRASAFYCFLCGGLSAGAAVGAWFYLPQPFLIMFTGACAVVLLVSGFWYGRAAKKQIPETSGSGS
jgi:hypothetical protein